MKAVAIVGPSDAGKTTLIERILHHLDEPVASIKSIHHDIEIDDPGTDTDRHRQAGAETVIGVTPSLTFSIRSAGKADRPDDPLLASLLDDLSDDGYEIVLVEGFTDSNLPKIVVGRDPSDEVSPVVARVEEPNNVDLEPLVDMIRGLAAYDAE